MKLEIIRLEEELRRAMLSSDVEKLDELIDESLVFITPDGQIATKQMDLEFHRNKIQKMSELNQQEQQIQIFDNTAIVMVIADINGVFGEIAIKGKFRYLRVWSKINDNWKIIAGSVTKIS